MENLGLETIWKMLLRSV